MRTVSITDFRANMAKELTELPFALTKDGKVLAKVCTEETDTSHVFPKSVQKKVIPLKKSVQTKKLTAPHGWVNPLANSVLAPKTGKK